MMLHAPWLQWPTCWNANWASLSHMKMCDRQQLTPYEQPIILRIVNTCSETLNGRVHSFPVAGRWQYAFGPMLTANLSTLQSKFWEHLSRIIRRDIIQGNSRPFGLVIMSSALLREGERRDRQVRVSTLTVQ